MRNLLLWLSQTWCNDFTDIWIFNIFEHFSWQITRCRSGSSWFRCRNLWLRNCFWLCFEFVYISSDNSSIWPSSLYQTQVNWFLASKSFSEWTNELSLTTLSLCWSTLGWCCSLRLLWLSSCLSWLALSWGRLCRFWIVFKGSNVWFIFDENGHNFSKRNVFSSLWIE